ncbi:hypothetical protein FNV43_RR10610 [Rhamnella rubrinervis]|uniref:Glycosyltransferase n=1 Tax=Rhamnella rubrinervis TaxID=2594499 RepID=A0A8K0H4E0_9ROSA|nr:hypothetical protein FNV43_RR10610 [Rhamnella rubrinervis]
MQQAIVLYPAPGLGHVISMVELGKLILHHYPHRFSIAILLTHGFRDSPAIADYIQRISHSIPSISFQRFSLLRVDNSKQDRSMSAVAYEFLRLNVPNVRNALNGISNTSTIKVLILDLFCTSALSLGMDLGIPTFYFFTSGASALAANDQAYWDFLYFCSKFPKANGIIANTFDEFEPIAMKAIEDGLCVADGPTPPLYYIGPLIAASDGISGEEDNGKAVEEDYTSWLDNRGTFSEKQVREIAIGLEKSEKRFLWVMKEPTIDEKTKQTHELRPFDLGGVLPEGFTERTRNLSMVVKSWVQQVEVLKKESVGVFVTHCRWNSVLEAVIAGVPMIAWPVYAGQHLNRNALVEDMKMAIPVEQIREDEFVSGAELEKRVRELVESEKGRELSERSRKMKEMSLAAFGDSGSSKLALNRFIDAIME